MLGGKLRRKVGCRRYLTALAKTGIRKVRQACRHTYITKRARRARVRVPRDVTLRNLDFDYNTDNILFSGFLGSWCMLHETGVTLCH